MADIPDQELAQLRSAAEAGATAAAALDKSQQDLEAANTQRTLAVKFLRDQARAANPTIPADLIDGDTPEAISAAVERGRAIAQQVLDANKTATPAASTAAAAPPRAAPGEPPAGVTGVRRMQWAAAQKAAQ